MKEEAPKNVVTLDVAVDVEGPKKFSAGACVLFFGGTPIDAFVGTVEWQDKSRDRQYWISTRNDVITWLMNRGLPGDRATSLVDGVGDHVREQIRVNREVNDEPQGGEVVP